MLHHESSITSWVWHHWNDASNPNIRLVLSHSSASLLPISSRRWAVPLRVKNIRFNAPPFLLDQSTTRRSWLPALREDFRSFYESSDVLDAVINRAANWMVIWVEFLSSTLKVLCRWAWLFSHNPVSGRDLSRHLVRFGWIISSQDLQASISHLRMRGLFI